MSTKIYEQPQVNPITVSKREEHSNFLLIMFLFVIVSFGVIISIITIIGAIFLWIHVIGIIIAFIMTFSDPIIKKRTGVKKIFSIIFATGIGFIYVFFIFF